MTAGFTLVELSIVLVIIGLIIGGVLVGQDLINTAGIRAQVSQIEKYNTAVNTFRGKYGYLPGDIPDPTASQYGFAPRGTLPGQGDGNGILVNGVDIWPNGWNQGVGEVMMIWNDLTAAHLIEGSFTTASSTANVVNNDVTIASTPSLYDFYPVAKIGGGNFVYVWSGGVNSDLNGSDNNNYFGLGVIAALVNGYAIQTSPSLSVLQAYKIDNKIDDGLPQSGKVMAMGLAGGSGPRWLGGSTHLIWSWGGPAPGTATPPSSTTCYDNANNGSAVMTYSVGQSNGTGINCGLSFRF
jgi:prepilin-type N-terminal cleavage/methylation domain-containing protein